MTMEYQIVFHYSIRIINVSITWWRTDGRWVSFSQRIYMWVNSLKTRVTIDNLIWAIMNECQSRSIRLLSIRLFYWIRFVIHRITSKCKSEFLGFLVTVDLYMAKCSHRITFCEVLQKQRIKLWRNCFINYAATECLEKFSLKRNI